MHKISRHIVALFIVLPLLGIGQINSGLIAHLPMNGNGMDISGNNNNATVSSAGVYPTNNYLNIAEQAMLFNGSSEQGVMNFGSALLSNRTSFSMSYWFSMSGFINGLSMVGQDNLLETGFYTGPSRIVTYHPTGSANTNLTGSAGVWHHLVVTCDATQMQVFLDGVLTNTLSGNYSLGANANITRIGGNVVNQSNNSWFRGNIDEVRFYDRVINATEIALLFNQAPLDIAINSISSSTLCAGSNLNVSFTASGNIFSGNNYILQMSGPTGSFSNPITVASLNSSATNGTFTATIPTGTPSGTNYRFRIASTNLNTIVDTSAAITINGTIGNIPNLATFRYIGNIAGRDYFVSLGTLNQANASAACITNGGRLASVTNQAITNLFMANLSNTGAYIGLDDAVSEGNFVWENGAALSYTNWEPGQPNNSSNQDYTVLQAETGKWNDIAGTELRYYFLELFPAGVNQNACEGTALNLNAAAATGSSYTWAGPNSFSSAVQNPVINPVSAANAGTYTVTYTNGSCSANATTSIQVNQSPNNTGGTSPLAASLSTGLILYYPMNGNATDASGLGNNGALIAGVIAAMDRFGNANSALQFNGTNGYMDVPDGVYFNGGSFTVNAWVRVSSHNSWARLFDFGNGPANNNVLFGLSNVTSGRPATEIYNGTVSGGQINSPSTTLPLNQWVMLTYAFSAGTGTIYLNGSALVSGIQTSPVNIVRTINYIGRSNWATDAYANARFDDFRIYNRLLAASEIQSLLLEQPSALAVTTNPSLICGNSSSVITLLNSQNGVSYQLKNATTSANIGAAQTGNGDTLFFNSGTLTATTSFHFSATVTATGCSILTSPDFTVNVYPIPAAPAATGVPVCNKESVTLSASGAAGGSVYNWYTVPAGGTAIATGSTYTTPVLDENTNYYVSVTSADGCEGTRTTVTATIINPLNPPVDIISNLILHYKFDGNIADSSGYGNNGSVSGTNNYDEDRNGNTNAALNVLNTGFVNAGNPQVIQQLTNQVTISMWIRQRQSWFGDQTPLVNRWNGNGMYMALDGYNPGAQNRVRWRIDNNTYVNSSVNVPLLQWHHIVCTYNGTQLKIYQNGVQTGTLNYTGSIPNTGNMQIGRQADGGGAITYRGDMDQLRIYNRALNASEALTLYNNESVAFANTPLCDGEDNLTLSTFNFPGATYNWSGPNGFTSTVQNPPVINNATIADAGLYTLQVTNNGCTSPAQTVDVVINPIPAAPTVMNDTVCGSGNADLIAAAAPYGGSYNWYTLSTGGTAVSGESDSILTITNLTATTNYYVAYNSLGCEGPRTAVTAVYNNLVLTNLTVTGSAVCSGVSTAMVTVAATETGVNYQAFSGSTAVSNSVAGGGTIILTINTGGLSTGNNTIIIKATRPGCGPVNLSNTAIVTIHALPSVTVTAGGATTFCAGGNVVLTSTALQSYVWSTGATTQNITVSSAGTYSLTATDANGCTNNSNAVTITVDTPPTPGISAAGATTFCAGGNVVLSGSGGTGYLWNTGATTSSITAITSGTYNVQVSAGTCSVISSDIIVTVNALPTVNANASATVICEGDAITLTGSGADTYTWNNGVTDGNSFVPTATTTYQVTGTGANGCSNTATVTITINTPAAPVITSNTAGFCPGINTVTLTTPTVAGATYQWLQGGSILSSATNATYTATTTGSYQVIITNSSGCSDTSAITNLQNVSAQNFSVAAASPTFCTGSSIGITTTLETGATYAWFANGTAYGSPALQLTTINVSSGGNYFVQVTNSSGCISVSDTVSVTALALPTASISASATGICNGDSVNLSAVVVSGATYEWFRNGTSLGAAQAGNASIYVSQTGSYEVRVDDGCSAVSNSIVINALNLPPAAGSITGDALFCAGEALSYTTTSVSSASSYVWTISPVSAGTISSGQGSTSISINSTNQNFILSVAAQNSCGTGTSGTYNVQLNTTFGACNTSVLFAANTTNVCVGNSIVFTNYSDPASFGGLTAQWNFGAGASPGTATGNGPHTVSYSSTGLKTVTLNYVDAFGNVFNTEQKINYVNVAPSVSTSSIAGNTNVSCTANAESYSVTGTIGSSYNWAVPSNATIVSGQGTNAIVVNFNGNTGNVSVQETNSGGCTGTMVSLAVSCTGSVGISSVTDDRTLEIYPNPVENNLFIQTKDSETVQLYMLDGNGRLIMKKTIAGASIESIDVSTLCAGVYCIKYISEKGSGVIRFIKQ